MTKRGDHLVVIGASAGGVGALLEICSALPRFFPAPICVVQHIGSHPSILPELLRSRGPNHAMHAEDGLRLATSTIYVAPPDHHMQLEGDRVALTRGPKENHARPAIDPLFRSAALSWGPRTIGVILSGQMDDGTAGLKYIGECGGTTIVQDPASAAEPGMPESALRHVAVDRCVRLEAVAGLLVRLVGDPAAHAARSLPERLARESALARGDRNVDHLEALADTSTLTCPDCGGTLWEMKDRHPLCYRCHVGHAYSVLSLGQAQVDTAEHALWGSVRALREREMLLRRAAEVAAATGDPAQSTSAAQEAERVGEQVRELMAIAERTPAPAEEPREKA